MKRICRICTNEYDHCPSCSLKANPFKHAGYCSENCYRVSMILQKYGSRVISAEDAMEQLMSYNVDNIEFQPKIAECYNNIKKALKPIKKSKSYKTEVKTEIIEDIDPQNEIPEIIEEDTSSFINEDMETTL